MSRWSTETKVTVGSKFGLLTVHYVDRDYYKHHHAIAFCLCDCGGSHKVRTDSLLRGETKSCGCLVRTHGKSKTSTYMTWYCMVGRCTKPEDVGFRWYGGRGIRVCERWLKFENFLEDMGEKPSKDHTLDRMDVDGNYELDNCRWATKAEQSSNRGYTRMWLWEEHSESVG